MAYERKDNTGAVFNNTRKEKDTHPDRTGDAMIGGRDYWVSGWVKQDRNGKPFLSLSFKPKDQPQERAPERTSSPASDTPGRRATAEKRRDMDDDLIPF